MSGQPNAKRPAAAAAAAPAAGPGAGATEEVRVNPRRGKAGMTPTRADERNRGQATDEYGRRKWDKDRFSRAARERLEEEEAELDRLKGGCALLDAKPPPWQTRSSHCGFAQANRSTKNRPCAQTWRRARSE